MEKQNKVIEAFIEKYDDSLEKRDYEIIKDIAVKKIAKELKTAGYKAIILSRIKEKESLYRKLCKRNPIKNYQGVADIFEDICDFLGIQILLYYPNEIEAVGKIIENIFEIDREAIRHPKKGKQKQHERDTGYKKIFSGYTAVHYHARLQENSWDEITYHTLINGGHNRKFEIQITSLVLHAWAEVEHDIVYKPDKSKLSPELHYILDEINGLMQVGEMSFNRLREELLKNINASGRIQDQYELSTYIRGNLPSDVLETHATGNMRYLFNLMKYAELDIKKKVDEMIKSISFGSMYYLAGEFIAYLMAEDAEYYKKLYLSRSNICNSEVIDDYKRLLGKYSELLHLAYKKGKELGKYEELKAPCNSKENFVDSLLAILLQEEITEIMKLRNVMYQISVDTYWQRKDTIEKYLKTVEKYIKKIQRVF